ncbi:MAG TPA: NADH-quinone oxidoreductase subunit M [Aggregatilineales bacterium]|nr:NADH-quinone oxidoreductase subunit M [Aggregatilineales bacterium]
MSFTFPVLTAIIFIPIVAAVIILFMNPKQRDLIRGTALSTATVLLGLSAFVYFSYNGEVNRAGGLLESQAQLVEDGGDLIASQMFKDGLRFEEKYTWVDSVGISYHVAVDGLNAPMILLTGMVAVAGVLISWRIEDRIREFMAFFLLLVAGVYGVFVAVDLFLLFFFYELAIFPMYLLIAGWGWVKLREYAAMKLTLYILIGSVVAFVGAIAMVLTASNFFSSEAGAAVFAQAQQSGLLSTTATTFSFDIVQLTVAAEAGAFNALGYFGVETLTFATFWFPFIFIGFAVLAGVFPFHNWSPDGHVAAPTAVSMIHAGVLMKLGAYAALRCGVQLMPEGAQAHLPWIVFLTLINVVYGAFIAFRQRDFKYVIGFSSVSHMGLVSMGWASMNIIGMTGAGLQMFSHGAMTALFFGCVGMVYDRAHTRDIPSLGGFIKKMPWVGFAFIVGGLASMGMPGLSGFIAEFPIFQGMWAASNDITLQIGGFTLSNYYSIMVILAALAIVITAAYVLRVTSQVFFGEFDAEKYPDVGDIAITDRVILLLLGVPLILVGMMPFLMAPMVQAGVSPVVAILGGM